MSLHAVIYFVKKNGSVGSAVIEIELTRTEKLPRFVQYSYDTALDDEVFRKFDPRLDWNQWTSNMNPFLVTEECKHVPRLGLTYLAEPLYSNALKKFPNLNLANTEEKTFVQKTRKKNAKHFEWEL
jgi:hypothetical protein